MPFCPECGERVRPNQTVCGSCKGDLSALLTVVKGKNCPRCGEPVGKNFSYCARCGFLLAEAVQVPVKAETRQASHTRGPTLTAIIIVMLVVFAAFAVTGFLRQTPPGTAYPITISQVDVHYSFAGQAASYAGSIPDSKFGPYDERSGSQFMIPLVIPPNPTPQVLQVESINVLTADFTLVSATPSSTILIDPGSSASLLLTIQAPPGSYDGILYLNVQLS